MKRVIRESAFETNSSSNHSVYIKRKTDKEEAKGKIVTPYDKMLFLWGLKSVEDASYNYYFENNLLDDEYQEQYDNIIKEANIYRDILIEECLKLEEFDVEKAKDLMDYGYKTTNDNPTCENYFFDGPLMDCTCNVTPKDIADFLGVYFPYSGVEPEQIRELAQKFFSDDNVYLSLEEWL